MTIALTVCHPPLNLSFIGHPPFPLASTLSG